MRTLCLLAMTLCSCATTARPTLMNSGPDWLRTGTQVPELSPLHVVFVAGFMNELIPGYFSDNVAVTRELGAETSVLLPPSSGALASDVALVQREIAARSGTRVVLFGHSKGGAAVLLTVLEHPELVLDGPVEAVIVLQGAIGGSPLADGLSKVRPLAGPGMRSLTTEQSKHTFTTALQKLSTSLTRAQWDRLFSRVFYLRSAHGDTTLAAELALTELALRGQGPNDGLLPPAEMKLGFGVDLGVLDADHAALTVGSFLATSTSSERRAFTFSLFREVGRQLGWPMHDSTPAP